MQLKELNFLRMKAVAKMIDVTMLKEKMQMSREEEMIRRELMQE